MNGSRLLALLISLNLLASPLFAQQPKGATTSLFNGKNLDGWVVTDCKVGVENGALVLQEGDGLVRSHHQYKDFVLELDWKARKAEMFDSGIYIRGELPVAPRKWPTKYQINLKQGFEGNVTTIKPAASTGLIKPGEWNHFKITVIGKTADMEINGKPAWKTDQIETPSGYIGFQAEVTLGGQFEFKNIAITELGHASLFNGRDLSGWVGAGADAKLCWQVEDGAIKCTGAKGPWLRSEQEYGDFNLRLEYRLLEGGNSGVFIRVPEDGNHHGPKSGIEIQALDDASPRYKTLKPYQYSASMYDFVGAEPRVSRAAGEWNTLEINCRGHHYTITHNGLRVVDADAKDVKLLDERRVSGFLGLQNHSEAVWFRNVRIGDAM